MKANELLTAKAENEVLNAQPVNDIELLKESGKSRGGIRLSKGQTVTFAAEMDPNLLCVTHSVKGNPIYHIKVILDNQRIVWMALGSFRKKPVDMETLKEFSVNYQLATMDHDLALWEELAGKTLRVIDEKPLLYPAFVAGQLAYKERVLDNGKTVSEPVYRELPTAIFEIVE